VFAGPAHRTGGRIDFNRLWTQQSVSPALDKLIEDWAPRIDAAMRHSVGQRNPSEWYKKEDCWKEMQRELRVRSQSLSRAYRRSKQS
jgi:hypothetical protein